MMIALSVLWLVPHIALDWNSPSLIIHLTHWVRLTKLQAKHKRSGEIGFKHGRLGFVGRYTMKGKVRRVLCTWLGNCNNILVLKWNRTMEYTQVELIFVRRYKAIHCIIFQEWRPMKDSEHSGVCGVIHLKRVVQVLFFRRSIENQIICGKCLWIKLQAGMKKKMIRRHTRERGGYCIPYGGFHVTKQEEEETSDSWNSEARFGSIKLN